MGSYDPLALRNPTLARIAPLSPLNPDLRSGLQTTPDLSEFLRNSERLKYWLTVALPFKIKNEKKILDFCNVCVKLQPRNSSISFTERIRNTVVSSKMELYPI